MEVVAANRIGFMNRDGFWTATATGQQLVYAAADLQHSDGCPVGDLAIAPSGAVAFPSGYCVNRPIRRGTADGAPLAAVYQPVTYFTRNESFRCLAADPAGGFYFVVNDGTGGNPRLYHVAEDASGPAALQLVPTDPSLGELRVERGALQPAGGSLFSDCSMTVAPNGDVFVQTAREAWRIAR
jgi:hypothetical protein